jgi:hypothetical protein
MDITMVSEEERKSIDQVCTKYEIRNYSINADGSIDVDGNVDFNWSRLDRIPLKFNRVSGFFDCAYNSLSSLDGCPVSVGGFFDCKYNKLSSLDGCPVSVGGFFDCRFNSLTSLKGCPTNVSGFDCSNNNLTSLEFCPTEIEFIFESHTNKLPRAMSDYFGYDNIMIDQMVFVKYQSYYDVWTPEFNIDGYNELVAEIRDGLK